jgi:FkbM family methyltransferase
MRSFLRHHFKVWQVLLTGSCEREYARLLLLHGDRQRYEAQRVKFLDYEVHVPDAASFLSQFREIFADGCYRFDPAGEAPVIFDCGANIGMSCLYFKRLFPRASIRAFEADPKIMRYLQENLQANGASDVQCVRKAVWIDDRGVEFQSEGSDSGGISKGTGTVKLESIRLKDELEAEKRVDLLKIDIEGAETEVLKDCQNSLGNVRNLFVEYHSFNRGRQELDEVLRILSAAGFRYFIQTLDVRKTPFVNRHLDRPADMQLNVFAYRL